MENNFDQIELSKIYNRRRNDRDIFQDLMPFKVKELLLVATYYDSYSIVREGRFFDKIFGEYLQLNLITAPRITSVPNTDEALLAISNNEYEMVILMAGVDMDTPLELGNKIKKIKPSMPILLLVNNNSDLRYFGESNPMVSCVDKVFVWNGDSRVFLAMIKYVEDKMNLASDIEVGDVRIILLVEDSEKYYTRYLPLLYSIVMTQTQNVMEDNTPDQTHKILKIRVRPKIRLVSTFEEAVEIVDNYIDNLLCVISDVKYKRNGIHDEDAGVELIRYVNSRSSIPCLLQSSDIANKQRAIEVNADFINKNSETLSHEITLFIHQKLGFGKFVFTNTRGMKIATASNLQEFIKCIEEVPAESLLFHAKRNGISSWLMARGEINLAKRLRPYRIEDFDSSNKLRHTILNIFEEMRLERLRGSVITFDKELVSNNRFISRIGEGSFGGKGRGVAFLSNFIENIDFETIIPQLNIGIPATTIVGAGEFSEFIESNNLATKAYDERHFQTLKTLFLDASLSPEVSEQLWQYTEVMTQPLAIRSSGLFEDSLLQPFAGVYDTFILPNNHPDQQIRYNQLTTAIKLIYASLFSTSARAYFEAVNYKIEEERMAIIIQQLVGHRSGEHFYPHISGVAQSYNYYPFSYMKPEDGFAVLGVGLGKYVVGGEKAFRFCPKYPKLELNSIADQIKDSQTHFYALNLNDSGLELGQVGEDATIEKLSIREAEEDGNLKHCAMVFDYQNDRLVNDFSKRGPRVVNFANILKYDYLPLAPALHLLLRFFREAMGSPVEIEFAVDLENGRRNLPTLYLLQIKPLIRIENHVDVKFDHVDMNKTLLKSTKGMGNGIIDRITDVIFMDVNKFDKTQTEVMAAEIEKLNILMEEQKRDYVLIGPGRWGTRDKYTGIPVLWSQISRAKIIVEMGLADFPLDASLGSHFFHNVTSMNVGYFSVHHNATNEWVNLEQLYHQPIIHETNFFKHVRFEKPLSILMNGKEQQAIISWSE